MTRPQYLKTTRHLAELNHKIKALDQKIWKMKEPIRESYREHLRSEGVLFDDEEFAAHLAEQGIVPPEKLQ